MVTNEIQENEQRYLAISTDFKKFGANRHVSCVWQFVAIFQRNWTYLLRNPRSLMGILFNGAFSALLNLALYWNIGDYSNISFDDPSKAAAYMTWVYNLKGFAFLLANNISFSSSSSVILQMPLQVPVFKRERANSMYSASTYFWGRFLSNVILQSFYPVSTILITYYGLAISDAFGNVLLFILYAIILNFTMCAQGYFCGTLTNNDQAAN